jgi:hypothetical protein
MVVLSKKTRIGDTKYEISVVLKTGDIERIRSMV